MLSTVIDVKMNVPLSVPGDTSLHKIIRNCRAVKEVEDFIAASDSQEISVMAKTPNNLGEIPYFILWSKSSRPTNIDNMLAKLLLPFTTENNFKKLSEKIHFSDVVAAYKSEANSQLYKNLELACKVANKARSLIKESSTHPQMDGKNNEDIMKLQYEIRALTQVEKIKRVTLLDACPKTKHC